MLAAGKDRVAGHKLVFEILDDCAVQLTAQPVVAVDHVFATPLLPRRAIVFLRYGPSLARLARLGEAGSAKERSLDAVLISRRRLVLMTRDGGGPFPKQMFAVPG